MNIWDCELVFNNLSNFLDGDLSSIEITAFQNHVDNCPKCEQFGNEFFSIIQLLRQSPDFKSIHREQKLVEIILKNKC